MLIPAYIIEEMRKEEQRRRESAQEITIQRSSIVPPDAAPSEGPLPGEERGVDELNFFI